MGLKHILLILSVTFLICQSCTYQRKSNHFEEVEELIFYAPAKAEHMLDSLLLNNSTVETAGVNYLKGFLLYQKGDIDSALIVIREAQRQFAMHKNKEGEGKCQFVLALIAEGIGQWEQAKINYYSTIKLTSQNQFYIGVSYFGIARCKNYLKENYSEELTKGNSIVKSLDHKALNLYANYLNIIFSKKPNKEDVNNLEQIASTYLDLNLNNKAAGVYRSIALIYNRNEKLDSAILFLDIGLENCTNDYSGISHLPSLNQTKGAILLKKNEIDSAKFYFQKALKYYDEFDLIDRKYFALTYLRKIAYDNMEYKEAYQLLDKALIAEKSAKKITKARTAKLMEISSDIFQLQHELNKQRTIKYLILLILVIVSSLTIYTVHIIKNKNRKRLENLRNRNNELNRLIVGINEKILVQKRCGREFEIKKEQDIKTITDQFDQCYRETLSSLLKRFKVLSITECRYALLFGLRYSDDTICFIQSVQKSAVRKARQRIRNKLDFTTEIDLNDYFSDCIPNNITSFRNEKINFMN